MSEERIVSSLNCGSCGLLVIDLQNAFLDPRGMLPVARGPSIIPRIGNLVGELRKRGVTIIWTRSSHERANATYRELCPSHFPEGKAILRQGQWNFAFHPGILEYQEPKRDWFLVKDHYSAFLNTSLEADLRAQNLATLFFTGVMTNVCVESSLRDAFQLDFHPILVRDCVATVSKSLQKASEDVISAAFGQIMSAKELVQCVESTMR